MKLSVRWPALLVGTTLAASIAFPTARAGWHSDNYTEVAKAPHTLGGYIYLGSEPHHHCQDGQRIAWGELTNGRLIDSGCWSYDISTEKIRIAWIARAGKPDNFYDDDFEFLGTGRNLHAWIIKEFMQPFRPVMPGLRKDDAQ